MQQLMQKERKEGYERKRISSKNSPGPCHHMLKHQIHMEHLKLLQAHS